jgi:hypothetical protein
MPFTVRAHRLLAVATVLLAGAGAWGAASALASTDQISIMEPGPSVTSDTATTMSTLQLLGVNTIRLNIGWADVAPDPNSLRAPKHFSASNPSAYPAGRFDGFDAAIRAASAAGIGVDLDVSGGSPRWAMPGATRTTNNLNAPNTAQYQAFYEAVTHRYSGAYTPPGASSPLPRVTLWSVWNEPNYTASLKPQTTGSGKHKVLASPRAYRGLVEAGWKALKATGHGHDRVLIGEMAPRGFPNVGGGGMYPLLFLQSLYCLDSKYHQLRGTTASGQGCPTNAAGSRRFRSHNPALFEATGISTHPYSRWYPPNTEKYSSCVKNVLCASLGDIGDLVSGIAKVQRAYGSNRRPPIYSTEYGYQTSPPLPLHYHSGKANYYNVSVGTAAEYLNWAEYLSYKNPRIASYDQYLLTDPQSTKFNHHQPYASGLLLANGDEKVTYDAYRLPLFLPKTSFTAGQFLEVWGAVRPAPAAAEQTGTSQSVQIEFEAAGSGTWTTIATDPITSSEGYFDTHISFPGSGTVRLVYTYPTDDLMLAPGTVAVSRYVMVTEH